MSQWPIFSAEEIQAVTNVLSTGKVNYWTGQEGRLFEKEFAACMGVTYAVAVANGTVALELCLRSLGIGPGDEVIVTSRTFVASASSIVLCGATPVFADVDLVSQNITVDTIDAVRTEKTKAIIAVHLAGWPCEMNLIMDYANAHGLLVIEDCAQAHGASIHSKRVGSWGHMAAFSFCQDKILTTGGEGGMVTTNDKRLWEKAWSYKDHGKCYDTVYNKEHRPGYRWLHHSFGTNWRMTEMQAAIGRVQLRNLDDWLAKRNRLATLYNNFFSGYNFLRTVVPPKHVYNAYYKYYVFVELEKLPANWNRDRTISAFIEAGVKCSVGSCSEIYKEKCFDLYPECLPKNELENARLLGMSSLVFNVYPTLCDDDILQNIAMFEKVISLSSLTYSADCL